MTEHERGVAPEAWVGQEVIAAVDGRRQRVLGVLEEDYEGGIVLRFADVPQ